MSRERIKAAERDYGYAIVNAFKDYLLEEQKAENTITNYCKVAKDFIEFFNIKNVKNLKKMKKLQVLKFINTFRERELMVTTINNHINAINCFFSFCKRKDLKVKTIYCKRKTYLNDCELLTDKEIHKILNHTIKLKDRRYYYAILIMLQTGIRVSELKFITVESLNKKFINILNKGSSRLVPMPCDLINTLKAYCEKTNIKNGIIIRTRNNKCLDKSVINKKLKEMAREIGIDEKKVHSHNFRHDFALRYISNKDNTISSLSDILGHRSIETTRIYTRKTLTDLRKTMTRKVLKIKIAI